MISLASWFWFDAFSDRTVHLVTEDCALSRRIAEPLGRKGPQEIPGPTPCSQQGHHCAQVGLLRALSGWVFKTSKDGGAQLLQAKLSQCLIILRVKISFHVSSSFSIYDHCLSLSHHAHQWRAWLHLLTDLLLGTRRLLFGPHLTS